jgi:ketosteroid isomerase-like protein
VTEEERENVENAIRGHAAFNGGDMEAALQYISPDLELHPAVGAALTGETVYRGHEGYRRYMDDITGVLEDLRIEPRTIAACAEWVVIDAAVSGHGRGSQVPFATDMTVAWRYRDGKAFWGATYFDRAEALKDVGLTEGD